MSTNHFSTDLPEPPQQWWPHHHQPPIEFSSTHQNHNPISPNYAATTTTAMFCTQNTAFTLNLNHHDHDDEDLDDEQQVSEEIVKESMFEKPLTPSDVGKLNRLVIPKQHAEKYFPLSNSDSVEKGLVLSFEDELGKTWKFRYSYWNSSQSYVLTKGWSRFVKEKKLEAGDIVLFERHHHDGDRFFIGWRRKGSNPSDPSAAGVSTQMVHDNGGGAQPVTAVGGGGGGGGWTPVLYTGHPYPPHGSHLPYQADNYIHAGSIVQNQTSSSSSGHPKRLRLFGVNLECQPDHDSEPSTPDASSSMSSHDQLHQNYQYGHQQYQHYSNSQAHEYHNYMQQDDMNFSRDVKQMQMRDRHG